MHPKDGEGCWIKVLTPPDRYAQSLSPSKDPAFCSFAFFNGEVTLSVGARTPTVQRRDL